MECGHNAGCKRALGISAQGYKFAITTAYFTKCGNIGTDHTAAGQDSLRDGKPEALCLRGKHDGLRMRVAPLQLRLRKTLEEEHAVLESTARDCFSNALGLWPLNSQYHQSCRRMYLFLTQQAIERPDEQRNVFVAPMLSNAQ